MPAEATQEAIGQAIALHDQALQPADAKAFMVIIDRLFKFARSFGLGGYGDEKRPDPDVQALTNFYRDGLADLPADLLNTAISRVCGSWKWGHKLPLPADIRAQVAEELSARKHVKSRLEAAATFQRLQNRHALTQAKPRPAVKVDVSAVAASSVNPMPKREPTEQELEIARQRMLAEMNAHPDFADTTKNAAE